MIIMMKMMMMKMMSDWLPERGLKVQFKCKVASEKVSKVA